MNEYKVDLVFNAYNEINSIEDDLNQIINIKKENKLIGEIFVIEDGSTDGTSEKLKELSDKININLNQSLKRRGYSNALVEGLTISNAEFVFFSDLGGKFNWDDINKLIKETPGNDLIIGKRVNRTDQPYRKILTYLYSFYIKVFYRIKSSDPDSGFRIYKKKLIEDVFSDELINKHLLNSELTIKCISRDCKYKEIPVSYFQREGISRGLPLKTIPRVILSTIKNSFKIKKQINEY